MRRVETTKICNQSAGFRLWWVGSGLEFSQPASDRLDTKIDAYQPNSTYALHIPTIPTLHSSPINFPCL